MKIQFDKEATMNSLGFSYTAIHPGEILKEDLAYRGIRQKDFAQTIAVPYTRLNEILNGKRPITSDFALLVEAALGTPAEHWLNMQARYNLQTSRTKESVVSRFKSIRSTSPWVKMPQGAIATT